ncbi:MAG: DUF2283 domain-containing protein [Candidatus Woesearchaeota archaeon]
MKKYALYDKENDIFCVHLGFNTDEEFGGNLGAIPVIFDVSTKGRIVGIEVLDASVFFAKYGISKEMLSSMEDANITFSRNDANVSMQLTLQLKSEKVSVTEFAVPLKSVVA